MIYGYARVSTDGQSVDAQVRQLRAAGARKVFIDLGVASAPSPTSRQIAREKLRHDYEDYLHRQRGLSRRTRSGRT